MISVDDLINAFRRLNLADFRAKLEKLKKQDAKLYNLFAAFVTSK